jgi:hypothetical protein
LVVVIAAVAVLAASCGDDDSTEAGDDTTSDDVADDSTSDDAPDDDAMANACPEEGCLITIDGAAADGAELVLTWTTNFTPEVARSHIHVYWDTFSVDEVSSDAESRGFTQGVWVPTDANPTFTTEGATSVAARAESTMLCVTAADRDHVVIDRLLVDCLDVSNLL